MEKVISDLTVVGGGLAGVSAAIAAARLGLKVVLINDRPVLGGNSSSEIRVWVSGATGGRNNRYSRETGIINEILTENKYRNPEGNPHIWDMILLDFVKKEPNIQLYLNTLVYDVEAETAGEDQEFIEIHAAVAKQLASERSFRFESPVFIDASGDGVVAYIAGAEYRMGRESKGEFSESMAPEEADSVTLGSTLLFYVKDAGQPVRFMPPSFACDMGKVESIVLSRPGRGVDEKRWGCNYWWIEYGGLLDTIKDNEEIRDELLRVVYGIWNYIKNSGKFNAGNLTLEWVGSLPGKRESRRFLGDYVLNQNDLVQQTRFPDAVCYGGWSIDVHPPEGIYSFEPPCNQVHLNGIYDIPFRCLYSRNVRNLMFAGRNISATHVAFASTRVMATCAAMGQAAGTAAFLCKKYGLLPGEIYPTHIRELQNLLLREDSYVVGVRNTDDGELARQARVTASSHRKVEIAEPSGKVRLDKDVYLMIPVTNGRIDELSLLMDVHSATNLEVELYTPDRPENYLPAISAGSVGIDLEPCQGEWVSLKLGFEMKEPGTLFVALKRNEAINLHTSEEGLTGIMTFYRVETTLSPHGGDIAGYHMRPLEGNLCFKVNPEQDAYRPENVINGYSRPYGLPNLWVSNKLAGEPEWLELDFDSRVAIREIFIYFNASLDQRINNLRCEESNVFPDTVKDYSIYIRADQGFQKLLEVRGNYQRLRKHCLGETVETDAIRLVFEATNGSKYAEVFEVRVY